MKYTVSKVGEEFVLTATWEGYPFQQEVSAELFRSKSEIKVLPNRLVVLKKNGFGLWDLYAPIFETNENYVRENRRILKVISNIAQYKVLDNYILYQVIQLGEKQYWQCISLKEDRFLTTVWNKKFEKLISKRVEEIPKIYELEVDFDRGFNKKYKYNSHLCMLKTSDKKIVVETGEADLGGELPINISYFDGEIKYLSTKHFSISNGNEFYVYPFEGKVEPISGPYKNVVDIGEKITYGLPKSIMPEEGWAGINVESKIENIYFKVGNKYLPREREIFVEFPNPADQIGIRKHETSKKDAYVISVKYKPDTDASDWKEIFDLDGIRFNID